MSKTKKTIKKIVKDKNVKGDRNQKMKQNLAEAKAKRIETEVSTGFLRDLLATQKDLRANYLNCMLGSSELDEMKKQLSGKITLQWYGVPMPKPVLEATFNAKLHNYKISLTDLNSKKARLKNMGLPDDKITCVEREGKLYKELVGGAQNEEN